MLSEEGKLNMTALAVGHVRAMRSSADLKSYIQILSSFGEFRLVKVRTRRPGKSGDVNGKSDSGWRRLDAQLGC